MYAYPLYPLYSLCTRLAKSENSTPRSMPSPHAPRAQAPWYNWPGPLWAPAVKLCHAPADKVETIEMVGG